MGIIDYYSRFNVTGQGRVACDSCDIILNHYDTWQLLLLSQLTVNFYFLVNVVIFISA